MEEIALIITTVLLTVPFEDYIASEEVQPHGALIQLTVYPSQAPCKAVSFLTQYVFHAAMAFFFLEALHAYR